MRLIYLLPLLLLCAFSPKRTVPGTPLLVDNAFTVEMPDGYTSSDQLLDLLKKANDKAVHAGVLPLAGARVPFLVSRYTYTDGTDIKGALTIAAGHQADTESYKLIEAAAYEKDGRTLYRKVSELTFDGGKKVGNIMYYFMKNGRAPNCYELKISCGTDDLAEGKAAMERIALSLQFR